MRANSISHVLINVDLVSYYFLSTSTFRNWHNVWWSKIVIIQLHCIYRSRFSQNRPQNQSQDHKKGLMSWWERPPVERALAQYSKLMKRSNHTIYRATVYTCVKYSQILNRKYLPYYHTLLITMIEWHFLSPIHEIILRKIFHEEEYMHWTRFSIGLINVTIQNQVLEPYRRVAF